MSPDRCVMSKITPGVVTLFVCSIFTRQHYSYDSSSKDIIDISGGVTYKIHHRFQIIKRGFVHPMQIVLSFDMDDAKALYDGKDVYVTRTAVAALKTATSIVNPLMSTPPYRHIKQREKGMSHVFPRTDRTMQAVRSVTSLPYYDLNDKSSSVMMEISQCSTLVGIIALGFLKGIKRYHNNYQFKENTAPAPEHYGHDKDTYGPFGVDFEVIFDDDRHNKAFASEWLILHPGHRMYSGSAQDFFDPVSV